MARRTAERFTAAHRPQQRERRILLAVPDVWRKSAANVVVLHGDPAERRLERAGGAERMARHCFVALTGTRSAEKLVHDRAFHRIVGGRRGTVKVYVVDLTRLDSRAPERLANRDSRAVSGGTGAEK